MKASFQQPALSIKPMISDLAGLLSKKVQKTVNKYKINHVDNAKNILRYKIVNEKKDGLKKILKS